MLKALSVGLKTLRLALPKIGVGWMFALLTIDFNRIAIVELGVTAVLVTTMLAMHYFLSPFQVIAGRFADRYPVMGYRRTPYMIAAGLVASLLFTLLPSLAHAMGDGSQLAIAGGFVLFAVFGIAMATLADSYHSLIAEVTTERSRSPVISVVWIIAILSTIFAAVVMNTVRPEYTPEAMQLLYNLSPPIVMGSILLGVLGLEKRLSAEDLAAYRLKAQKAAPPGNPIVVAFELLQTNAQTRNFFVFIFLAIFAIFLQDNILEVFGAEVFAMTVAETTRFQPTWGAGVLLGMVLMGLLCALLPLSKKHVAVAGCLGTAGGMAALAMAAVLQIEGVVLPALFIMGMFTGAFNVGALAMMMDMTIEGATGLYMGLWGIAQAFGNGFSSITSGWLHTTLIGSGALDPSSAYGMIFSIEAACLVGASLVLLKVSVAQFHETQADRMSSVDLTRAMEAGSVA